MNTSRLPLILCFAWILAIGPGRASDYVSQQSFPSAPDKKALVKEYVATLLEEEPKVIEALEEIEAPVVEEAGGRYSRGPIDCIEWFSEGVISPVAGAEPPAFTRDESYVYVIRIPLRTGFRGGWEQSRNALAVVRMTYQERGLYEGSTVEKAQVTLRFEGFVDELPAPPQEAAP